MLENSYRACRLPPSLPTLLAILDTLPPKSVSSFQKKNEDAVKEFTETINFLEGI